MQIKNKVLTQEEYELQMNKMLEQYTSPDQLKAVAKDMYSDTYFMVPPDVEAASDDMRPNCFMWDAERGEFKLANVGRLRMADTAIVPSLNIGDRVIAPDGDEWAVVSVQSEAPGSIAFGISRVQGLRGEPARGGGV